MKPKGKTLTRPQCRLIERLAVGDVTFAEAIKAQRLRPPTLKRWLTESAFRRAISALRRHLADRRELELALLASRAVQVAERAIGGEKVLPTANHRRLLIDLLRLTRQPPRRSPKTSASDATGPIVEGDVSDLLQRLGATQD